ncbi:MAG TPA: M1 family metallopeptidase [Actinomycetes bacterium]|jgi:aminopeptidase N|nr:M1 family metallopeptidase [Actinomycetes bacterium]
MSSMRLRLGAVMLAVAVLWVAAPAGAADGLVAGSPGLGDPFFPLAGNGGYDVSDYSLKLSYDPATRRLDGTATISATATQNLSSFDLDLRGFEISRLSVNDRAASFTRDGQEVVITPRAGLRAGRAFTVVVDYSGVPAVVTDPDQSIEGWVPTDDGAFVVGEPQGSPAWYPVNDSPHDKATFEFTVTVPDGITVMANGVLASQTSTGGKTTFVWRENSPMAPYLATATLGRFDVTQYELANGIPVYVAVDPTLSSSSSSVLRKLPDIVDFYSSIYGPYPFDAAGAVVDDAKNVGYSLETQTKPVFDRPPDEATLAHELSHMWYGDSVTLTQWPDIWLHEGFATWSEWIWSEHLGHKSAHKWFNTLYNTPAQDTAFWTPPPADPGSPVYLFNGTIYYRGAMTLQALREKVGDVVFFRILRDWAAEHRYGNVTTPQFIALAEHESGMSLQHFFDVWLYQPDKPTSW